MLIGLVILYAVIHLFVLQNKAFGDRTPYEKVVSVIGMVGIGLVFIGAML